jgi:hypothetical protein
MRRVGVEFLNSVERSAAVIDFRFAEIFVCAASTGARAVIASPNRCLMEDRLNQPEFTVDDGNRQDREDPRPTSRSRTTLDDDNRRRVPDTTKTFAVGDRPALLPGENR